jgi:3-mercaptopyruvate sulfurtransferase SseA
LIKSGYFGSRFFSFTQFSECPTTRRCMRRSPTPDSITPIDRADLTRARQLVTPAWLAAQAPATIRLLEVGYGGLASFLGGHIPGAGYLDTAELELDGSWRKVPDQRLLAVLLARGIRHDSTVVLYGRNYLAAARTAHLMLYSGVRDVRLLDGGFAQWTRCELPLAHGLAPPSAAADSFGAPFPGRPAFLTSMEETRDLLAQGTGNLVSIRSRAEFVGKTSGYGASVAPGDIAGALWGQAGEDGDVNSMSAFLQTDGSLKPAADIAAMWREHGIVEGARTVFYCGTGWRASFAFFAAWLMNWENISVYEGGWFEWRADPANPVIRRIEHNELAHAQDANENSQVPPCKQAPYPTPPASATHSC